VADDLPVGHGLVVPGEELVERHSHAGGPGGQGVNTSSTRVTLRWNVRSSTLAPRLRERLLEKLANRVTNDGEIVVHASEHRSQLMNREAARERLAAIVRDALAVPKKRRATKPSRASKQARVEKKKARSQTKRLRGRVSED
jgi:ribosome-associated protein